MPDKDKGSAFLDLGFLIKDETSSLKGSFSDDKDMDLTSLYFTPDGKIGGLPEKAANLINKTKDNARIERIS